VLLASVPPELHAVPDLNRCIAIGSCAERFEPFVVERDLDSGWALVSAPSETQHAFARRTADGVDQSLYVLYALDWIAVDDACPTGGGLIGPDVASLLVERR